MNAASSLVSTQHTRGVCVARGRLSRRGRVDASSHPTDRRPCRPNSATFQRGTVTGRSSSSHAARAAFIPRASAEDDKLVKTALIFDLFMIEVLSRGLNAKQIMDAMTNRLKTTSDGLLFTGITGKGAEQPANSIKIKTFERYIIHDLKLDLRKSYGKDAMIDLFDAMDENGDGFLDMGELNRALQTG